MKKRKIVTDLQEIKKIFKENNLEKVLWNLNVLIATYEWFMHNFEEDKNFPRIILFDTENFTIILWHKSWEDKWKFTYWVFPTYLDNINLFLKDNWKEITIDDLFEDFTYLNKELKKITWNAKANTKACRMKLTWNFKWIIKDWIEAKDFRRLIAKNKKDKKFIKFFNCMESYFLDLKKQRKLWINSFQEYVKTYISRKRRWNFLKPIEIYSNWEYEIKITNITEEKKLELWNKAIDWIIENFKNKTFSDSENSMLNDNRWWIQESFKRWMKEIVKSWIWWTLLIEAFKNWKEIWKEFMIYDLKRKIWNAAIWFEFIEEFSWLWRALIWIQIDESFKIWLNRIEYWVHHCNWKQLFKLDKEPAFLF